MKEKNRKHTIIVEDDTLYAKSLQKYPGDRLPAGTSIHLFPVGELCIDNLYLDPDAIVSSKEKAPSRK